MTLQRTERLGTFQMSSSREGTASTLDRILAQVARIREAKLNLILFPEALLRATSRTVESNWC